MTKAIQVIDLCRDMKTAQESLWAQSLQDGFLGGRVLPFRETQNEGRPCVWARVTVQTFFVDDLDDGIMNALLCAGLRRVVVPEGQSRMLGVRA